MSPEAQQMALEILMACPPREFLTRALGKMLTSSRIADWMHAFSDELLHTFAEYIKMAHAQSAGVQQSFKTTRRVADRFQMLSPDEERGLDIYPGAAYIFYNPQTNLCFVNAGYCTLMNRHPEETMARLRSEDCDFCHAFNEIDALCTLVDNIQLTSRSEPDCEPRLVSRYYAISRSFHKQPRPDVKPVLVHQTIRTTFTETGQLASLEKFLQPISAQDFNFHLATSPHLCRPLTHLLGDSRSGEQLLAEYELERACTMSDLSRRPEFQHRMRTLAAYFRASSAKILAHSSTSAPQPALSRSAPALAPALAPSSSSSPAGMERCSLGSSVPSEGAGADWEEEEEQMVWWEPASCGLSAHVHERVRASVPASESERESKSSPDPPTQAAQHSPAAASGGASSEGWCTSDELGERIAGWLVSQGSEEQADAGVEEMCAGEIGRAHV